MNKPTPEQFGLTAETVASLTQEQAQRNKRRNAMCDKITMGLGAVGAVAGVAYALRDAKSIGDVFALLVIAGAVLFSGGFILAIVVYRVLSLLSYIVFPDPPSYRPLKRYKEAIAQYEAWFIRTQQAFWDRLTGRGFEIEVTNLLNQAGYHARLTPASGDQGVDIVLGDGTIVQCKAHRAPASPGVVRELYGALIHQKAPKALLISRSGWTKGVHSFIQGKPITVWDTADLIALQKGLDESRGMP